MISFYSYATPHAMCVEGSCDAARSRYRQPPGDIRATGSTVHRAERHARRPGPDARDLPGTYTVPYCRILYFTILPRTLPAPLLTRITSLNSFSFSLHACPLPPPVPLLRLLSGSLFNTSFPSVFPSFLPSFILYVTQDESRFLRDVLSKVSEKDEATNRHLQDVKESNSNLSESLHRATLDLQVVQRYFIAVTTYPSPLFSSTLLYALPLPPLPSLLLCTFLFATTLRELSLLHFSYFLLTVYSP